MNVDEARNLLPMYADGLLDSGTAQEVETVLAAAPDLQAEYQKLKEENALISEALAPLHPSKSTRIKLSEAMQEAAEHVAHTIPARGWRIFRYIFAFVAVVFFMALVTFVPLDRPRPMENSEIHDTLYPIFYPVSLGAFLMGLAFILCAPFFTNIQIWIMTRIFRRHAEKTTLRLLLFEVFGMVCVVAAGMCYLLLLSL
jgi:hypothetical protein